MTATDPSPRRFSAAKLGKYLFLAICLLFAIFLFSSLFEYSVFYEHYVGKAAKLTGLNTYVLRAVGVAFFIPFAYGMRLAFHPFSGKKRKLGYALTLGVIVTYNLTFFFLTRNQNFSVSEGQTLRWYSIRVGKVEYYDRAGFDPLTGAALKPVTPTIATRLLRWERGTIKRIEPKEDQFFDPITGDALLWYAKANTGEYEFFDGPGFHPNTREPLREVSPQVFEDWSKIQRERAAQMALKEAGISGQNFADGHGEPLRWYSLRDGSVHYFDHAGLDPISGVELQPVTKDNAQQLSRWERGEVTRVEPKDGHFFNTITGEPLYWYAKLPGGTYEFFDGPGFHPTTRAKLEPVTPEIVTTWQRAAMPTGTTTALGEQFPEARTRLLRSEDIRGWDNDKIRFAINVMYAHGGYDFRKPETKRMFLNFPWYLQRLVPGRSQDEAAALLTPLEKTNLEFLQNAALQVSQTASTKDGSATDNSFATVSSRRPDKSWDRPHIYLQLADESQRQAAVALRRQLVKIGYVVTGIENSSGNEGIPTEASELRFFTDKDSLEAQRIAHEVQGFFAHTGIYADLPEGMPYVSHTRQYEIWFSSAYR